MPLVTSERATGPKSRPRTRVPSEAPSKPQEIGGNGGKIQYLKKVSVLDQTLSFKQKCVFLNYAVNLWLCVLMWHIMIKESV